MNNTTDNLRAVALPRLVRQLIAEAKDRKRRMIERQRALKGDEIRTPSRGPIQKNGRKCIRWHFYESARSNHRAVTEQVTQIVALLPNDPDQIREGKTL